jgi:hypothetical protein
MLKENAEPIFEGLDAPTLFRQFACECVELAQSTPLHENGQRLASDGTPLGKERLRGIGALQNVG